MKKFFTTLALALLTLAASAQENPNRVIVKQKYKAPVGQPHRYHPPRCHEDSRV